MIFNDCVDVMTSAECLEESVTNETDFTRSTMVARLYHVFFLFENKNVFLNKH